MFVKIDFQTSFLYFLKNMKKSLRFWRQKQQKNKFIVKLKN